MSLEELEQAIGCLLPEPLLKLYQASDGQGQAGGRAEMRLMSFAEVADFHQFVQGAGWAELGVCAFWTDDNSNYMGLYVAGPLTGKLCFIDHEEVDLSPVYASVQSFLDAMTAAPQGLDVSEFSTDYPAAKLSENPQTEAQDWEIAQALRSLFEADTDNWRTYYAFCVMALTPFDQTGSLLAFATDGDLWIQERVCAILKLRRYEPAVSQLAEVARDEKHKGQLAAIKALGLLGLGAARVSLEELLVVLPQEHHVSVESALKRIR